MTRGRGRRRDHGRGRGRGGGRDKNEVNDRSKSLIRMDQFVARTGRPWDTENLGRDHRRAPPNNVRERVGPKRAVHQTESIKDAFELCH